jgi:hypothetical protein
VDGDLKRMLGRKKRHGDVKSGHPLFMAIGAMLRLESAEFRAASTEPLRSCLLAGWLSPDPFLNCEKA